MARIDTTDNGKVIRETKARMQFAARICRHFAGYTDKLQGDTIPLDNGDMLDFALVEPLGVLVLITAWNSPLPLLANKLAPALATGDTAVVKPSQHASASTQEFGRLIEKADFPAGVVNIVIARQDIRHLYNPAEWSAHFYDFDIYLSRFLALRIDNGRLINANRDQDFRSLGIGSRHAGRTAGTCRRDHDSCRDHDS